METVVADAGIDKDEQGIEGEGEERQSANELALELYFRRAETAEHQATDECQHEENDAKCKDGGKQVDEFECARVTLGEVDAGNAAVVDLAEEFPEVGAALMPYPCALVTDLWEFCKVFTGLYLW